MSVKINIVSLELKVGSSYSVHNGDETEEAMYLEELIPDGDQITAIMRLWEVSSTRWEKRGGHGPEPDPTRLILTDTRRAVSLSAISSPLDVVHAMDHRKVLKCHRGDVYFFSHAETSEGKTKKVGQKEILVAVNRATRKRMIGARLRIKVTNALWDDKLKFTVTFPFPKEEVMEILAEIFQVQVNPKSTTFLLSESRDLDEMCGYRWDVVSYGEKSHLLTSLQLRTLSSNNFIASLTFSQVPRIADFAQYRRHHTLLYFLCR